MGLKQNFQPPCLPLCPLAAYPSEMIIFSPEGSCHSFLIDCPQRRNSRFLSQAGPESLLGGAASSLPHTLTPSWAILATSVGLIPLSTGDPRAHSSRLEAFPKLRVYRCTRCLLDTLTQYPLDTSSWHVPNWTVISPICSHTDLFHFPVWGTVIHQRPKKPGVTPTIISSFSPNSSQICPLLLPSPSPPVGHHHLLPRQLCKGPNSWSCDWSLPFSNHPLPAARMIFLKGKAEPIIPLIALLKLLCLRTPNARRVNQIPGGLGWVRRSGCRSPRPQCEVSF